MMSELEALARTGLEISAVLRRHFGKELQYTLVMLERCAAMGLRVLPYDWSASWLWEGAACFSCLPLQGISPCLRRQCTVVTYLALNQETRRHIL